MSSRFTCTRFELASSSQKNKLEWKLLFAELKKYLLGVPARAVSLPPNSAPPPLSPSTPLVLSTDSSQLSAAQRRGLRSALRGGGVVSALHFAAAA